MNSSPAQDAPKESFHGDNHTLPSVLVIGTDTGVLSPDSEHRARMIDYARHMRELHIVVLGSSGTHPSVIQISEKVCVYPTHTASRAAALKEGLRICKTIVQKHAIDVISSQDPFETAFIGYRAKKHSGHTTKLNIQEHGDFFFQPYWKRERVLHAVRYYLGLWLIKKADCVRVVSERTRKKLIAYGVPSERIASVPVRTDISLFTDCKPNADILAMRPENGVTILTIARLVPQKNLGMLVRAFASMVNRGAPAHLVIVGDGPEKTMLEYLAHQLAPQHISFLPWTDDAPGYIQAADIYALSSNYEGWGRVCVETLAAGTPIVMTDVGCAGEVVVDGENGIVTPVGDEQAFTDVLSSLVSDTHLRQTLSEAGKKTISNMPTKEEYDALYRKSLKCCSATPHESTQTSEKNT